MLKHIEEIITEYISNLNKPLYTWDGQDIPSIISTGNGKLIILSRKIEIGIKAVAQAFKKQFITTHAQARLHTNSEWVAITRKVFVPLLHAIDPDVDTEKSTKFVYHKIENDLLKRLNILTTNKEYVFGCLLFHNTDVQPFTIGPVRFVN